MRKWSSASETVYYFNVSEGILWLYNFQRSIHAVSQQSYGVISTAYA